MEAVVGFIFGRGDYIEFVDRSVASMVVFSISLMFIIWGAINLPNVLAGASVAIMLSPIVVPVKVRRIAV